MPTQAKILQKPKIKAETKGGTRDDAGFNSSMVKSA